MKSLIIFFILFATIRSPLFGITEESIVKRVHAHLLIGDVLSACSEARSGLQLYPGSKIVGNALIRALAKKGEEKAMMGQWQRFIEKFPEECENRELLECLAWSIIENGALSSSPKIRITAMLGGFFSQDAKGVVILRQGLRDENSFLRAAAIKLSTILSDSSLEEEILRLFKSDKSWQVRLEAIKAIGILHISEAKNDLTKLILNPESHAEEQSAAIHALVLISDELSREHISYLVESKRMGMRLLACEFIAYFEQKQDLDLLFPLLFDPHAEVRAKIFQTLGRLRISTISGHPVIDLAVKGTSDANPYTAISAAWLLAITDQQQGLDVLEKGLYHPVRDIRHFTAAAIAATGKYGISLALKYFNKHEDQYVRMNLALGMIGQRIHHEEACASLYKGLLERKEKWMWEETHSFRMLAPSKVKHDDAIPDYPEAVNQLTRLEVLQMLCMMNYPHAQHAIRNFLQEQRWEISGLASALLLTEGDESAIDLVKELLNDADSNIKIQAALILALWGKEENVVNLLQEYYHLSDRELKSQILEGIGRVGSSSSLIFLTSRLQEPYQSLRIVAAAALLECLYH
jgi:HEAT repeat protein